MKRLTLERGAHGYDPATPNMGALFIASGPSFKHGRTIDAVVYLEVDEEEQWRRVRARSLTDAATTFEMTRADLERWRARQTR